MKHAAERKITEIRKKEKKKELEFQFTVGQMAQRRLRRFLEISNIESKLVDSTMQRMTALTWNGIAFLVPSISKRHPRTFAVEALWLRGVEHTTFLASRIMAEGSSLSSSPPIIEKYTRLAIACSRRPNSIFSVFFLSAEKIRQSGQWAFEDDGARREEPFDDIEDGSTLDGSITIVTRKRLSGSDHPFS